MASFDITQAAGHGYAQLWSERRYLVRLAAVPLLVKLVCFTTVLQLGWERDFLRLALVMLPSYFADGWLFSHLVRLVLLDQRWPFRPAGDGARDMRILQDRALGVMRGTLTYALSRFAMGGVMAVFVRVGDAAMAGLENETANFGLFMLVIGLSVFLFWGFRLLWLYIPAAVNYPLGRFMGRLGGFGVSFYLLGTWLLCFVPVFLISGMVLSIIDAVIAGAARSAMAVFMATVLRMLMDLVVGTLATIAFANGFRQMLSEKK